MSGRWWVIYDSRAAGGDTSQASVLCVAHSRREAKADVRELEQDGTECAVFSYQDNADGSLTDERGPYRFGKQGQS